MAFRTRKAGCIRGIYEDAWNQVYVGLVEALASKEKLPGEDEQLKRRKLR